MKFRMTYCPGFCISLMRQGKCPYCGLLSAASQETQNASIHVLTVVPPVCVSRQPDVAI